MILNPRTLHVGDAVEVTILGSVERVANDCLTINAVASYGFNPEDVYRLVNHSAEKRRAAVGEPGDLWSSPDGHVRWVVLSPMNDAEREVPACVVLHNTSDYQWPWHRPGTIHRRTTAEMAALFGVRDPQRITEDGPETDDGGAPQ